MKKEWYGVKLIYKYTVRAKGSAPAFLFEESVVLVKAKSFDKAYRKVEKQAKNESEQYENTNGQQVTREFYRSVDCYWLFDKPGKYTEAYSSFFSALPGVPHQKLIQDRYSLCTQEELAVLRRV